MKRLDRILRWMYIQTEHPRAKPVMYTYFWLSVALAVGGLVYSLAFKDMRGLRCSTLGFTMFGLLMVFLFTMLFYSIKYRRIHVHRCPTCGHQEVTVTYEDPRKEDGGSSSNE